MTAPTCSTCKHWNSDRTDFRSAVSTWALRDLPPGHKLQMEIDGDRLYGLCQAVQLGPWEPEQGQTLADAPLAIAVDGSEYRADLLTRAEFGCVLHEVQVSEEAPA